MSKEQLRSDLTSLLEGPDILGEFYFLTNLEGKIETKFADLDENTQRELTNQFIQSLRANVIENAELFVKNLSEVDERKNVIYQYDHEDEPQEFELLRLTSQDSKFENFNFKRYRFSSIKAILIQIINNGHTLVIYKQNYPVTYINRDTTFNIIHNNQRLIKLESDILKVNADFELFRIDETFYIKKLDFFESKFKFHEIIFSDAKECIKGIKESQLLEDPGTLDEMLKDLRFSKKLANITKVSPVLGKVSNKKIIDFICSYPAFAGKLTLNEARDKIVLKTKKSKQIFIKMLQDDFLYSQLTDHFYDSIAKDEL